MLKLKQFSFNPFGVSTFLVYDTDTLDAFVVDPGMISQSEKETFVRFIEEQKLNLRQIVNTHLHLDHCFGDNFVRDKYAVKIKAHADDAFLGDTLDRQAYAFGVNIPDARKIVIDEALSEDDVITVGSYTFNILHVPGHSPGGIALYCSQENVLISGDVLFQGSIGRTDLPGGDMATLLNSISSKIFTLPDNTKVYPGHGGSTTVALEKKTNPFFR